MKENIKKKYQKDYEVDSSKPYFKKFAKRYDIKMLSNFKNGFNTLLKIKIMFGLYDKFKIQCPEASEFIKFSSLKRIYIQNFDSINIQKQLYYLMDKGYVFRIKKTQYYEYCITELGLEGVRTILFNYVNRLISNIYYFQSIFAKNFNEHCVNLLNLLVYGLTIDELRKKSKEEYIKSTPQYNDLRLMKELRKGQTGIYKKSWNFTIDMELVKLGKMLKSSFYAKYNYQYDKSVELINKMNELNELVESIINKKYIKSKIKKKNKGSDKN